MADPGITNIFPPFAKHAGLGSRAGIKADFRCNFPTSRGDISQVLIVFTLVPGIRAIASPAVYEHCRAYLSQYVNRASNHVRNSINAEQDRESMDTSRRSGP